MKIGLFFGSFNPIHVGHLIIANYMAEFTDLEQVWLVVSPQNPFKKKQSLANDYDRLFLAKTATDGHPKIHVSNVEFGLPQPSYTIDTLAYLKEKNPEDEFYLIMGGDNLGTLHKWKNADILLRDYKILVFKRPHYELGELRNHPSVTIFEDTPLMQISATFIRKCVKKGKSIRYLVTTEVEEEIKKGRMYQQ